MEMHWILTLQWSNADGQQTWTGHGLTYPLIGETRSDLLKRLMQEVYEAVPIRTSANIMFFDLAPNKLNGE